MSPFAHKKSLGQNFLTNHAIIERIVDLASISDHDVVIEIGPGQGALTEALAKRAKKVLAIELDERLISLLQKKFDDRMNVTVIHGDILSLDISALLAEQGVPTDSYKVVANIPYYITAPIIRLFLEQKSAPHTLTLMVQKEVAERLCAQPGDMSIIAVAAQFYADVTYGFTVSRTDFDPMPAVDSAVVQLTLKHRDGNSLHATTQFFRVVKIGFSARRKKLSNNVANGLHWSKDDVLTILRNMGIKESVRAQELSVDQWWVLTQRILEEQRRQDHAE